jgi:hypothetical protein
MDEAAYRQALSTSIQSSCPFEKSVLTHCAACSQAAKRNIAEREVVTCTNTEALENCTVLRDMLRQNFTFALGKTLIEGPLPHAQEMRMQCGGLRGLQYTLDGSDEIGDVSALLLMARHQFGELADWPYAEIVRLSNTYYKVR